MNQMRKLLILGGGIDQIPGILKAKEMGIYTIVLDGNIHAKAKDIADEFYQVSIKHIEQVEYFVLNTLKHTVDGVIAFGVDIPYILAKTADMLNVNYTISSQNAKLSEDKFQSKEFMNKHNIPIPQYKLIHSLDDLQPFIQKYNFPIILKPVDNSAARGISYIENFNNLENYFNYALRYSNQKKIIAENFLTGPQITTEAIVVNSKVYNICCSDRNYSDMHRFLPNIIENGGDLPSINMKKHHHEQLLKYLNIITQELSIQNGIIKGDIVINHDRLIIIEFALRLSGGNFSGFQIQENTGVDFLKLAIKIHLNIPIHQNELIITKNRNLSVRFKFSEDERVGIIKRIIPPIKNDNILLSNFHIKKGDKITNKTSNHAERLGFAIATGIDRNEAIQNAQSFLDNVEIIFE